MTINEAISAADALKPNQYDAAQKRAWLSELDGRIHRELILTHAHDAAQEAFTGYGEEHGRGHGAACSLPLRGGRLRLVSPEHDRSRQRGERQVQPERSPV